MTSLLEEDHRHINKNVNQILGGPRASKRFFFEKKKQKTSVYGGICRLQGQRP
jgi:hypothetical protein